MIFAILVLSASVESNLITFTFQSFIFLDMEGTPIQEVAALEVNRRTNGIVDVFLAYAHTDEPDTFACKHIHGLNKAYLKEVGFPSEDSLLTIFKLWLSRKPYVALFANDSRKESISLGLVVKNFNLPPWADRRHSVSHKFALRHKELSIPILNRYCPPIAHNSFVNAPSSPNAFSSIAKARHGYHCALYDCQELYFESIML